MKFFFESIELSPKTLLTKSENKNNTEKTTNPTTQNNKELKEAKIEESGISTEHKITKN